MDGVVESVNKEGIEVYSGPIKCYVKEIRMPNYEYDTTTDQFVSPDPQFKPIKKGCAIRHKIETLRFERNEFIAISSIYDHYLGVIQG